MPALSLWANASEQLDPGDHEPGAFGDHVERSEGKFLTRRELVSYPHSLSAVADKLR
jgi:hypothetical protein